MKDLDILSRGRLRRRLRAAPKLIRAVRVQCGLTQAELAHLIGVSQASASKYERGQVMPGAATLGRLSELLAAVERTKP
jgi:transcriptional regulator with XRE-family HTH domain